MPERIRGLFQFSSDLGEQIEFAEVSCVFDGGCHQRTLRIIGLAFQSAEMIDSRQEVLGLKRACRPAYFYRVSHGLDPFLRCLREQAGQDLQCVQRLAMQRAQIDQKRGILKSVGGIVRRFQHGEEDCVVGVKAHGFAGLDDQMIGVVLESAGAAGALGRIVRAGVESVAYETR